jgi:hypothetical protein
LSYGDYVEQLTFLLFLKMADEQSRPPFNTPSPIPNLPAPEIIAADITADLKAAMEQFATIAEDLKK